MRHLYNRGVVIVALAVTATVVVGLTTFVTPCRVPSGSQLLVRLDEATALCPVYRPAHDPISLAVALLTALLVLALLDRIGHAVSLPGSPILLVVGVSAGLALTWVWLIERDVCDAALFPQVECREYGVGFYYEPLLGMAYLLAVAALPYLVVVAVWRSSLLSAALRSVRKR